jgi:hypothetical protein
VIGNYFCYFYLQVHMALTLNEMVSDYGKTVHVPRPPLWSLRPYSGFSRPEPLLFLPSRPSIVLTRLSGPPVHTILLYFSKICYNVRTGIATGYRLGSRRVGVRVPVGVRFFSSSVHTDQFCGPPCLLSSGYRGFFPEVKAAGV